MTIYAGKTSIEDDRDTFEGEGNIIYSKEYKGVIIDVRTNSMRNDVAHHYTTHHTITNSYRQCRIV